MNRLTPAASKRRSALTAKQSSKIASCFDKGSKRLPYLAGEVRFQVRVDTSGKAKSVHAIDSHLGDVETEECMMIALALGLDALLWSARSASARKPPPHRRGPTVSATTWSPKATANG